MNECINLLFENIPLPVHICDKHHQIMHCNEVAVNIFGLKHEQEYISKFNMLVPEFQPDGGASVDIITKSISKAFDEGHLCLEFMHQTLGVNLCFVKLP